MQDTTEKPRPIALRLGLFVAGALGLAALFANAILRLPPFGGYRGPYGPAAIRASLEKRKVTDVVSAVNFDIRAIDTVGEEFILFASVIGAVVLLREQSEKKRQTRDDQVHDRSHVPHPGEAVRLWALSMTGPMILFGLYIVIHGQLTPGGGFQGGVILATAPLITYLAENYETFKKVASQHWVEAGEALGAAGFVAIGFLGLLQGGDFLTNALPLAEMGSVLSGGIIPLISLSVGLEVASGFVLLLSAFLQKTLAGHSSGGAADEAAKRNKQGPT